MGEENGIPLEDFDSSEAHYNRYAAHVTEAEKRLDRALCNFCNEASDAYEPVDQWNDGVQRNLAELCDAYNEWYRMRIMDPAERERADRWADACATASYIMDRFRDDMKAAKEHTNLIESHLHRNIADAINGTLKQSAADRKVGKRPGTMIDQLNELVASGELVSVKPRGLKD